MRVAVLTAQVLGFVLVLSAGFVCALRGRGFWLSAFVASCLECVYVVALMTMGMVFGGDDHLRGLFPEPMALVLVGLVPSAFIHGLIAAGLGVQLRKHLSHRQQRSLSRFETRFAEQIACLRQAASVCTCQQDLEPVLENLQQGRTSGVIGAYVRNPNDSKILAMQWFVELEGQSVWCGAETTPSLSRGRVRLKAGGEAESLSYADVVNNSDDEEVEYCLVVLASDVRQ